MKTFYLLVLVLFMLFIGCSHTYETTKYYPKERLYEDFNRLAENKLEITLTNDSSINVFNGAKIQNEMMKINHNSQISISKIQQVSYNQHWGGVVLGLPLGIIAGGVIGATGWIYHPEVGGSHGTPTFSRFQAAVFGAIVGMLVGSIIGYIHGYKYFFIFNH